VAESAAAPRGPLLPTFRRVLDLLGATFRVAWKHDCLGQAKGAAYSTVLFFFPLLLFAVTILVATNIFTQVVSPVTEFTPGLLPSETRDLVLDYVDKTAQLDPTKLFFLSFVAMLWTGWGLMSSFIEGVNRAFDLHEDRALLRNQWAAIKLLVAVSLPILGLGALIIAASAARASLAGEGLLLPDFAWRILRWGLLILAMVSVNGIIYRLGVHRKQRWREVAPGALLATGIWVVSTVLFRSYVTHFGRYNLIYGSLGAAIILFVWMYFSCFAVLLGGEFNAVLAHARASPKAE
jgi:membrane protein